MELKVEQLTKKYGEQVAVNNISFALSSGEIVGFLGPNGAGKSTTLKIITGYLPPSEGSVKVGLYDIKENRLDAVRQVGYLAEGNPLYLDLYVMEFLRFVGRLYGLSGKNLSQRIETVIEMAGLTSERTKKIENLSKGYRKRVGVAQALIHDPQILILDEPTDGLDVFQVVEIRNLIQSFSGKKTILFSSHILSEVEALASRVIIIHKGNILTDVPLSELSKSIGGDIVVRVEFEKIGFNTKKLSEIAGIISVEPVSHTAFTVRASRDIDARKIIYQESISQNISLLKLSQDEAGLEELFQKIKSM